MKHGGKFMKYCYKCGNQMEEDMLFCSKCGTKVIVPSSNQTEHSNQIRNQTSTNIHINSIHNPTSVKKIRKGMLIFSVMCFIFAGVYALLSITDPFILGMATFFSVLGIMFVILAKSPKNNPYILAKQSGIKKSLFVIICVFVAFISFFIIGLQTQDISSDTTDNTTQEISSAQTLSDVQKWYENQIPMVSQSLIEYAQSVQGISNINVTESHFRFGENFGWYDCHYTIYFVCNVNGENCTGEARAFLKYEDTQLSWFHFEIFRDSDWQTMTEHYDESYDQIIENYYKELEAAYKS